MLLMMVRVIMLKIKQYDAYNYEKGNSDDYSSGDTHALDTNCYKVINHDGDSY